MKKYLLIFLLVGIALASRPQTNTVGLIAHYKMWDGLMTTSKIFDYTCNGNDGTLQDSDNTLVPTYPGFYFDGVDDHIEIDDATVFTPALTTFSISAWVNMTDATNFVIISKGVVDTNGEWGFYSQANDLLLFQAIDESQSKLGADVWIARYYSVALTSYQGSWIHLVATYDGGTVSTGINLYLNGSRIDNSTSEQLGVPFEGIENGNGAVHIGRLDATYSNGTIDNVMFFDKELTAIEAKNIYEVTRWRYDK